MPKRVSRKSISFNHLAKTINQASFCAAVRAAVAATSQATNSLVYWRVQSFFLLLLLISSLDSNYFDHFYLRNVHRLNQWMMHGTRCRSVCLPLSIRRHDEWSQCVDSRRLFFFFYLEYFSTRLRHEKADSCLFVGCANQMPNVDRQASISRNISSTVFLYSTKHSILFNFVSYRWIYFMHSCRQCRCECTNHTCESIKWWWKCRQNKIQTKIFTSRDWHFVDYVIEFYLFHSHEQFKHACVHVQLRSGCSESFDLRFSDCRHQMKPAHFSAYSKHFIFCNDFVHFFLNFLLILSENIEYESIQIRNTFCLTEWEQIDFVLTQMRTNGYICFSAWMNFIAIMNQMGVNRQRVMKNASDHPSVIIRRACWAARTSEDFRK